MIKGAAFGWLQRIIGLSAMVPQTEPNVLKKALELKQFQYRHRIKLQANA